MQGNLVLIRESDEIVRLRIVGDFTNETTPQYQKVCNEVTQDHRVKGIILDFDEVTSVDTSAFACMINFIREHADKNVKIGMVHIKEEHKALLEILKLENVISYFGSKEEALLALMQNHTI